MLKKHTFWLSTAAVFQLLSAAFHSLSFIVEAKPANETEQQLTELMATYKLNTGDGFHHSTQDFFNALSACFPLLMLFACISNFYLLRKKVDVSVLKGIVNINLIIFGPCFVIMTMLTFLPPVICTGLIFLTLIFSRLSFPRTQ